MNLDRRRDPRRRGVRVRAGQPRSWPTTSCSTRRWRGRAGWPGRRRSRSGRSRRSSADGRPRRGHRGREGRLRARRSAPRTRKEGIGAFLGKRDAEVAGTLDRASSAWRACPRGGSVVALTGAGISVPSGIPDFRSPGTGPVGERRPDGGRAHRRLARRSRALLALLRRRFQTLQDKQPNGAHAALVELERRGRLDAVVTQNIDRLHRRAGTARARRGPRDDRALARAWPARRAYPLEEVRARLAADADGVPRCDCGAPLKPDVVLFGEFLPEGALGARVRAGRRRRRAAVRGLVARGPPGRPAPGRHARQRRRGRRSSPRARRPGTTRAAVQAWTATSSPSCAACSTRWPARRSVRGMGRVVHFEVHAEDLDRAAAFYRDVLGVDGDKVAGRPVRLPARRAPARTTRASTARSRAPRADRRAGRDRLGLHGPGRRRRGHRPARRRARAGRSPLAPDDVPGVGRLAYLKDTEGNVFGVLQPAAGGAG